MSQRVEGVVCGKSARYGGHMGDRGQRQLREVTENEGRWHTCQWGQEELVILEQGCFKAARKEGVEGEK